MTEQLDRLNLILEAINIKGKGRGKDVGVQVWNDIFTRDPGLGKLMGTLLRQQEELKLKNRGNRGLSTSVVYSWLALTENKKIVLDSLKKAGWKKGTTYWTYYDCPFTVYVDDKHADASLTFTLNTDFSYIYNNKAKTWSVYNDKSDKLY